MHFPSLGREDSLEKEMATHSSMLAGKIPWTEESGRPQYTGSKRGGRDSTQLTANSNLETLLQLGLQTSFSELKCRMNKYF